MKKMSLDVFFFRAHDLLQRLIDWIEQMYIYVQT